LNAARLFAAADLVLFYALVLRCVQRADVALAAALVLLVTPAHVLLSRTSSLDGVWPLPFVLTWAVCVMALAERPSTRSRWMLASAAASLLGSIAVQRSSALMVVALAAVTVVMFRSADGWQPPDALPAVGVAAAGVVTGVLLLIVRGGGGGILERFVAAPDPTGASLVAIAWHRAATVSAWVWNFFLPSHLFLNPEAPGFCGMFLTPAVVPMAAGIHALAIAGSGEGDARLRLIRALIVGSGIGVPLAAALVGPPPLDGRALIVVPLGILLAVIGARHVWHRGRLAGRVALGALCVLAAIQTVFCLA
jgi:hypothetical protein